MPHRAKKMAYLLKKYANSLVSVFIVFMRLGWATKL